MSFFGADPAAIIGHIGSALQSLAPAPAPQGGFQPGGGPGGPAFQPAPVVAGSNAWPTMTIAGGGFQPAQMQGGSFQPSGGLGGGFQPGGGPGGPAFQPAPVVAGSNAWPTMTIAGGGFQPAQMQGGSFQPSGGLGGGFQPSGGIGGSPFTPSATNPLLAPPKPTTTAIPGATTPGTAGATYTGLKPEVAQWAGQVQGTFGKYGGWVPDAMLAIIQHESSGNPNVQNQAGYPAYGLFQLWEQPGLTADQQFTAAESLLQQKLKMVNDAYVRLGITPDDTRRARDLFLAWSGQFDPATAGPSANRDVGSGEDGNAYLYGPNGIMPMYQGIVSGKQSGTSAANGTGMLAGPWAFPVVGYQGQVQTHWGTGETGASDIMAPGGTSIVAMHGGRVIDAGYNNYGGWTVTIQDEQGRQYYYAHMMAPSAAQVGQTIATGALLGLVGNTGDAAGGPTHLHIGITAPNTNIKLGNDAAGGAGWAWGSGPQDNAVGLLQWVLNGGR